TLVGAICPAKWEAHAGNGRDRARVRCCVEWAVGRDATVASEGMAVVAHRDAAAAGLVYVDDLSRGLTPRPRGSGVLYYGWGGKRVRDPATLDRIQHLAIPPAWHDVWIAPKPNDHIQAIGRDARGRRQYRYHAAFRGIRDSNKFEHITTFARALPKLRRT